MRKLTFILIALVITLGACNEEETFYPYASLNPSFELIYDYNGSLTNHVFLISVSSNVITNIGNPELQYAFSSRIRVFNVTQNESIIDMLYNNFDHKTGQSGFQEYIPIDFADVSSGDVISFYILENIGVYSNETLLNSGEFGKQFYFTMP